MPLHSTILSMSDGGQATLSDLKQALKDTLAARGALDQIKARIRAEIFAALENQNVAKPKLSNENLVINELIREYFEYNGYRHALSVFLLESGQPAEKSFDRRFLSSELNVTDSSRFKHTPLLYSIVTSLQQQRHQEQQRERKHSVNDKLATLLAAERTFDHDPTQHTALYGNNEPSPGKTSVHEN